jgi:WhiB family transcriptional regulator, redox-sensing transcriptional regulator
VTDRNTNLIDLPQIEWTEQEWRNRAACKGEPTQIFFAVQGQDVRVARKICNNCPVRVECLQWAVDASIQHGIFGGRVPRERRALRKGYRWIDTCGTMAGAHRHLDTETPLCPACIGVRRDRGRLKPDRQR